VRRMARLVFSISSSLFSRRTFCEILLRCFFFRFAPAIPSLRALRGVADVLLTTSSERGLRFFFLVDFSVPLLFPSVSLVSNPLALVVDLGDSSSSKTKSPSKFCIKSVKSLLVRGRSCIASIGSVDDRSSLRVQRRGGK